MGSYQVVQFNAIQKQFVAFGKCLLQLFSASTAILIA
jgi:hypothetical protein